MTDTQFYVKIAALFYGLGLVVSYLPFGKHAVFRLFPIIALAFNGFAAALRYFQALPMLPMYLGPVALSFFMGVLTVATGPKNAAPPFVHRTLLSLTLGIAAASALFPKDYYLPFIKSQAPAAHLFFLFGVVGRGCFMMAAAWALAGLLDKKARRIQGGHAAETEKNDGGEPRRGDKIRNMQGKLSVQQGFPISRSPLLHTTRWIVWGFGFFTFSMFSGELWSYLGWGTPVVWDDPAITTTMAIWFYYICWLHLHLTGTWSAQRRGIFAVCGAPAIFSLNLLPELGPFRWPF